MKTKSAAQPSLLLVLLMTLVSSCVKDPVDKVPDRELFIETDASYGPDSRQRMTVALPEGRDEKTPIVILIHGGAWIAGDKTDLAGMQQVLLQNQIGSISINYRFVSENHHFEGLMEDVGLALAAVTANAEEWGIRTAHYQLLGASAGAHMALLYAYGFQRENEVSAVISVAGPTAFPDEFLAVAALGPLKVPIEAMAGAPIATPYSPRFSAAGPISYLTDAVPTLLIHGTADTTVPYALSTALEEALENNGKTVQLITLDGVGHDFLVDPTAVSEVANQALAWINTYE